MKASGGTPATAPSRNSSGWARVVGAAGGDVDRDVADQPHAALGARSARSARPLALEAHLVGDARRARRSLPVADPERVALAESRSSPRRTGARGIGQQPRPGREGRRAPCTASRSGPAARAAASATTSGRPRRASRRSAYASVARGARRAARWGAAGRRWTSGSSRDEVTTSARGLGHMPRRSARPAAQRNRPRRHPDRAPEPDPSTAGATRPSARSATRSPCRADVFRDGHDVLRAVVRYRAPGRRALARAPMHRIDAHVDGDRWAGAFAVDALGPLAVRRSRPGPTPSPPGATSCSARSTPARTTSPASSREGVVLLEARRARAKGADAALIEHALDALADDATPDDAKHDAALDPELARRRRAHRRAPRRDHARAAARRRRRPRARALRRLVRALPALLGRLRGRRRRSSRGSPSSASTSSTCRRSTRSARRTARAATTRSSPARATPARPWAIGDDDGGHDAIHPELGTLEDFDALVRDRARARHRHRAGLRDPVLGRPPVADRAPRVVQPPPRRHAEVRREPAQEVPGHLQRQLGLARTGAGCGRRCSTSSLPGSTHGVQGLPRRQPAHQAARRSGSG